MEKLINRLNRDIIQRLAVVFGVIFVIGLGSCADMNKGDYLVKEGKAREKERASELILSDIEYGQHEIITLRLPLDTSGSVDFTVTGKGSYPGVNVVNGEASVELTDLELGIYPVVASYSGDSKHPALVKEGDFAVIKSPRISVIKTSTPANGYAYDLEEEISYKIHFSFYLRDSTDFTVSDPLSGGVWHTGELREGNFEYNANYNVREIDVNEGEVSTVIEARGTPAKPGANQIVVRSDTIRDPTVARSAHLHMSVFTDPVSGLYTGDAVNHSFRVLNNGNITVSSITLVEDHSGSSWSVPSLAPGEYADFVYNYEVTQADFDTSSINFLFRANGTSAHGANPPEASIGVAVTTDYTDPRLSIVKEADPTSDVGRGDVINYHLIVTNIGDVSVKDGVLVDDHADLSGESFNLAPGDTVEFNYTYTVTQADVDAGEIVNTVYANATSARGDDPEEVMATSTSTAQDPASSLSVMISANRLNGVSEGEVITYHILVTNIGNVSVLGGSLNSNLVDLSDRTFALAPGEFAEFDHVYTVTAADVSYGQVYNHIRVNATAARGSNPSEVETYSIITTSP